MMLGLFGLTAIAVTWPLAVIAPSAIGLGPIGAQTVPFRLIVLAAVRRGEHAPEDAGHRGLDRRGQDPLAASPRSRAIDTTARGHARTIPASPADLRRTGVSRSRGALWDHPTARA